MKFSILTPTTGHPLLVKLLNSIDILELNDDITIEHLIVVDGPEFKNTTDEILNTTPNTNKQIERYVLYLPYNTGGNGYHGHKIYSSMTQILTGDYIIFLDNDNWLEPKHIINYYNKIKNNNLDWVYSLRRITTINGEFICNDDCESLGYLSNAFYHRDVYFIDTNCTCVKREFAILLTPIWNRKGDNNDCDPDRLYSRILMSQFPNYDCTLDYTLNYTVENRENSVNASLFVVGNDIVKNLYHCIPWQKPQLFICHFNKDNTEKIIKRIYQPVKEHIGYNQWQLNILDCMDDKLCISAYNPFIPSNKKVLFHMCHVHELPSDVILRSDIEKILYTIESPNIRHQGQWELPFLEKTFSRIITYWEPLLIKNYINYFPFIHRFDFNNGFDMNVIKNNVNMDRRICIVLERRDYSSQYNINGINLKSQDYLRWKYASHLGKRLYCYGKSWEPYNNVINYCEAKNRFLDEESVIDIMEKYTFALIIENCNAVGYVSEKIYDALTVGCIPLYYGNNTELLGIPKDCYIDLTTIDPIELPSIIDSMDIEEMRHNIYDKRMSILEKVSVGSYNKMVSSLLTS